MKLPLSRVAEFTHATGEFDQHALATGYSIDSRTVQQGDLFFAVKGERHGWPRLRGMRAGSGRGGCGGRQGAVSRVSR